MAAEAVSELGWEALIHPSAHKILRDLVNRLLVCATVRQCLFVWYFLTDFVFFPAFYQASPKDRLFGVLVEDLRAASLSLNNQAVGRAGYHAAMEAYTRANAKAVVATLQEEQRAADHLEGRPAASRTALLVYFAAASEAAALQAQPFVDLLRCLAKRQGMPFVHDTATRLRFAWVGRAPAGVEAADTYAVVAPPELDLPAGMAGRHMLAAMNATYVATRLDGWGIDSLRLLQDLTRGPVWRCLEQTVEIIDGNPIRWAKVDSIARALESHDAVVYLDHDVTPRVDCLGAARLLDVLFAPNFRGVKPSIVIRDSPAGVDCLNTGFVAFRNTPVSRAFLAQWRAKLRWPGVLHADQGAFAETLLEFLSIEYRASGLPGAGPGYDYQCLEFLVPARKGWRSWRGYCDCFQLALAYLGGGLGFGNRDFVIARFVNPREVDLNFVPNSLTPAHMQDLRRMNLLPRRSRAAAGVQDEAARPSPAAAVQAGHLDSGSSAGGSDGGRSAESAHEEEADVISPFFVHWAGIENRTRLMQNYLMRRFGVPPVWFQAGRDPSDRCAALAPLAPRASHKCRPGVGDLGTAIEEVW